MFIFILLLSLVNAYDPYIANIAINLCQSTYCITNTSTWNCITCDPNIKLEYVVENNGARALQGYDSNTETIFTAFRGSSNIQNWIDNIQISRVCPYNEGEVCVEKGFYKAYNYLKPEIFNNLQTLSNKYNTNKLLITGHSLGAAESTLMTYDILNDYTNYKISYFYNFGSPRVGNPEFVSSFNSYNLDSFRIVHYYDIVPHVPEEILGYKHISTEIWYNEENSEYQSCNDNIEEDDLCSNSCAPTKCTSTSDHVNYLNVSMGNDPLCYV
jgi:hypothetical protein